jgi:hypothetical protein
VATKFRGRNGVMWKFGTTSSCKSLGTGQTVFLLLVHWFWILPWHIHVMEDHSCLLSDSWHTEGVRMVLLRPMEFSGRRLGQKFDTTDSCILIAQTRYLSWMLTHPAVFMTILVAYFFCTFTGKPQLCLMRYRKNRSNSVFFGRLVMLILRDQWGWF